MAEQRIAPPAPRALMISAVASGAGKSMVSLALLRALKNAGHPVAAAKSGPDYLDPTFHRAASGAPSVNLDAWAMDGRSLRARAWSAAAGADLLLVEGAMGLLDGAPQAAEIAGRGSSAALAEALGAPVVVVLDVARQGQSAAAVLLGLRAAAPGLEVVGAILNRVGSAKHERLATQALRAAGATVFGAWPNTPDLATPSRHLGLRPAEERDDLEAFLEQAGRLAAERLDLDALSTAARPLAAEPRAPDRLPPLGQRIAVARDAAFSFLYPHLLEDWRAGGAEICFFSPLADEAPDPRADAVYLPGGYPELHVERLSAARAVWAGLRAAARRGAAVYGECGGYMALGDALEDGNGRAWPMAGLLPLTTSMAAPRRTLGYRRLRVRQSAPASPLFRSGFFLGHEFHYATVARAGAGEGVFDAWDAEGAPLGAIGLAAGSVAGSFAHLIAPGPA